MDIQDIQLMKIILFSLNNRSFQYNALHYRSTKQPTI